MMSIAPLGAGTSAADYCLSVAKDDYYAQGAEPPGNWFGRGLPAFALKGRVEGLDLRRMLLGDISAAAHATLTGAGCRPHRAGWDCTFSAPKTVSVAWALAAPNAREVIQASHNAAVSAALTYLEDRAAFTRRGHGGHERERLPGLAVATFQHSTSRMGDPQLHTHCLVLNLAQRADGSVGTLESRYLYQHKMAAGAVYQMALGTELARLGYDISKAKNGIRLRDVPEKLCEAFSKRRQQISQILKQKGLRGAVASQIATLETRKVKEEKSFEDLLVSWRQQAGELGIELPLALTQQKNKAQVAAPSIASVLRELTHDRSVFIEADLVRALASESAGALDYQGLTALVKKTLVDPAVVRLKNAKQSLERYTTKEMLELEAGILRTAKRMAQNQTQPISATQMRQAVEGMTLSDEQQKALEHVLSKTGQIALIEGMAGTGKTHLLSAARLGFEAAGYTVHGCALSGKAAQNLEEGSGIKSVTLHSLLKSIEDKKQQLTSKDVVVLDEAGMVGSRQFHSVLNQIAAAGAKLVLVGDSRQLQPIEAGQMFRVLAKEIGKSDLKDIRRQVDPWARQAVADIASGGAAQALSEFDQRGLLVRSSDHETVVEDLAKAWMADALPMPQKLVVAGTRLDAFRVNSAIRECLIQSGALQSSAAAVRTQSGATREFAANDRLIFLRNDKRLGVRNGSLGTVIAIANAAGEHPTLEVRLDDGKRVSVPTRDYAHLDHGYALTVHKAQGTTVNGNVYVLTSEAMTDREWSYVALSRARQTTRIFTTLAEASELDKSMKRSRAKETALDYQAEPAS